MRYLLISSPYLSYKYPTPENSSAIGTQLNISTNSSDLGSHYVLTDLDKSLVLWVRAGNYYSNLTNTSLKDLSSYNNQVLTSENGSTVYTNLTGGPYGSFTSFHYNSSVYFPWSQSLNISSDFSFGIWYKQSSFSSRSQYFFWNTYSGSLLTGSFTQFNNTDLYLAFTWDTAFPSVQYVSSCNVTFMPTNWSYLTVTKNNNMTYCYLNGALQSSSGLPSATMFTAPYGTAYFLNINPSSSSADYYNPTFSFDSLTLFNRSLQPGEVASLYNATAYQYQANFSSLRQGTHTFQSYAVDSGGAMNSTGLYSVTTDTINPNINFTNPTPASGSFFKGNSLYINISSNDTNTHYTFSDLDRSLISWLRMDDCAGSCSSGYKDMSSWSNNATVYGNVTQSTAGAFGDSALFDGSTGYLQVANYSLLPTGSASRTIIGWIKTSNSTLSRESYFGYGGIGPYSSFNMESGINNDGKDYFVGYGPGDVAGTKVISDGNWHQVAVSYNSSVLSIYIDGALDVSASRSLNTTGVSSYPLTVGRQSYPDSPNYWYVNGKVDELMLFNRSLQAGEISSLYNASAYQYQNNLTGMSSGYHSFTGYSVDIAGNMNQTETRNIVLNKYTNCASGCLSVKNTSGSNMSLLDKQGNIDLAGTLTQSSVGVPNGNDLIFRNTAGSVVAWIDGATGNMRIAGTLQGVNQSSSCSPPANSFIVRDTSGNCVSYIDSSGNLWIKGVLGQNTQL